MLSIVDVEISWCCRLRPKDFYSFQFPHSVQNSLRVESMVSEGQEIYDLSVGLSRIEPKAMGYVLVKWYLRLFGKSLLICISQGLGVSMELVTRWFVLSHSVNHCFVTEYGVPCWGNCRHCYVSCSLLRNFQVNFPGKMIPRCATSLA